ncbi:LAGLIDADG family homing endonuclease [Candidatus Micrarchaeota archaeon]|nr:LAGLIDADG family homing endonuclease [Candidatus Micrarchaeota archaeon]MBU1930827.1 LAGLIDADG family homing endonuclease [Candidatus Micrarchaeota archaeon]
MKQISETFSTSKGAQVPGLIKSSTTKIKAAFLRAFWDDEGCISDRGVLSGTSSSEKMVTDLILIHNELGIECYKEVVRQPTWTIFRLVLRRNRENFNNFITKIGFEHAIVTKGYHVGKYKSDVLLEKYTQKYVI